MHLGMAIHATAALGISDGVLAKRSGRSGLTGDLGHLCAVRRMALIAQEGWPRFQHELRVTAMGSVAVAAVFIHRFMGPYEGTTLFHVALIAGFNGAITLQ